MPGVPGQLELHNEALSQNKQTSTHSPSKKKRQKEKERDRERWKRKYHKKQSLSLRETNTILKTSQYLISNFLLVELKLIKRNRVN